MLSGVTLRTWVYIFPFVSRSDGLESPLLSPRWFLSVKGFSTPGFSFWASSLNVHYHFVLQFFFLSKEINNIQSCTVKWIINFKAWICFTTLRFNKHYISSSKASWLSSSTHKRYLVLVISGGLSFSLPCCMSLKKISKEPLFFLS